MSKTFEQKIVLICLPMYLGCSKESLNESVLLHILVTIHQNRIQGRQILKAYSTQHSLDIHGLTSLRGQ